MHFSKDISHRVCSLSTHLQVKAEYMLVEFWDCRNKAETLSCHMPVLSTPSYFPNKKLISTWCKVHKSHTGFSIEIRTDDQTLEQGELVCWAR